MPSAPAHPQVRGCDWPGPHRRFESARGRPLRHSLASKRVIPAIAPHLCLHPQATKLTTCDMATTHCGYLAVRSKSLPCAKLLQKKLAQASARGIRQMCLAAHRTCRVGATQRVPWASGSPACFRIRRRSSRQHRAVGALCWQYLRGCWKLGYPSKSVAIAEIPCGGDLSANLSRAGGGLTFTETL